MVTNPMKLLAVLVHRGLVSPQLAREALASGDPGAFLARRGACTPEQWQQWQRSEGGTRPVLTRYDVRELLGEGAVGRVFAAIDRTDQHVVALKVLRAELATDPAQTDRFVREARLLMELQHEQLVKGLRVAKEGDTIFFAMEKLPGRVLQDVLVEEQRLDEESALQIVVEVAGALGALHARGFVHRDVKPGNVMWSEERGAVLIDLGFAVAAGGDAGGSDGPSATTAGTVHYIAPEQARGSSALDVRADIYALGATLYHLVTGSLPFEGRTSEEVLAKQVLESLSGEHIRALGLSPQLHWFLEKMMAKEPELRFQDAAHVQREVEAFLEQRRQQRELDEQQQRAGKKLGEHRKSSMFDRRRRRRPRR
jgi:eukaryotic-like serine/threonine-protein kinase